MSHLAPLRQLLSSYLAQGVLTGVSRRPARARSGVPPVGCRRSRPPGRVDPLQVGGALAGLGRAPLQHVIERGGAQTFGASDDRTAHRGATEAARSKVAFTSIGDPPQDGYRRVSSRAGLGQRLCVGAGGYRTATTGTTQLSAAPGHDQRLRPTAKETLSSSAWRT